MTFRVLIVDDEPLARQRVRRLLDADPEIMVLGEASDGKAAVDAVRQLRPDLVFLDVQMPGLDGFGVLHALDDEPMPSVIFVTAHDRFALKAFEVHALDYLLKPFDKARFCSALERAKTQIRQGNSDALNQQLKEMLNGLPVRQHPSGRLMVKTGTRIYFVRIDDIDWVEAAANYVRLHVGKEEHLLRESLSAIEKKLDPSRFVRIHRSTIVNLDRIREMQPLFHGDYVVILRDGKELGVSRTFRERLEASMAAGS